MLLITVYLMRPWSVGYQKWRQRLDSLQAELKAIALWDDLHLHSGERNDLENHAYQARKKRRREIFTAIAALHHLN